MSAQGLEMLDHTVQLTHEWINELAAKLGWGSRRQVLLLLRASLAALRDQLGPVEAARLSAQLPVLIRGLLYEGWRPEAPVERSVEGFATQVGSRFGKGSEYRGIEDVVEVFNLLNARISQGEVRDMRATLPADVRALWPDHSAAA
jgi:uncharacterized protein (DUF2267 family)